MSDCPSASIAPSVCTSEGAHAESAPGEDDAQLNLGVARGFLRRGFISVAMTQLQTVAAIYPGTAAAAEATVLIQRYLPLKGD